jgi:carbonic anhydrase/acetyltransferase-like protein (isoleucine patch superfamily)
MIIARNGHTPRVHPSTVVAPSAQIIGNVTIGTACVIDYNVVVASSGPPILIADHVLVFANSVIRSVGGGARPAYPVDIADHTLIAPLCVLTGCRLGPLCYIATGAIILQGASLGEGTRIGVGAIVHAGTQLPDRSRVGMRHFAVPGEPDAIITADVEQARDHVQEADFFEVAFGLGQDSASLHREVIGKLLEEVAQWRDEPSPPNSQGS